MTSIRCGGFVDPGWEHGTAQDEKKKKVRCNYCGKVVSGGIYRLKQHLARLSGEVTYCDKAPEEVCLKMKDNLEGCRIGKKPKQIEYDDQATYLNFPPCENENDVVEEEEEEEEEHIMYDDNRNKGKQQLVVLGDKGLVINMAPPPPHPLRSLGYVDPGWEHGVPRDERKKKVKCNYCDKIVSGGINRFKQHLARIPGEVAPCKSAPEEVYLKIKENMKWHRTGRRHRRPEPHKHSTSSSAFYTLHSENENENEDDGVEEEDDEHLLIDKKKRFVRREDALSSKKPKSETTNDKVSGRKEEVMSAVSKFFYYAGVPTHAANSPYFHKMLEMVSQHGPPSPSSVMLSSRLLEDELLTIKTHLAEYKASWAVTGCSILADTWKDAHNRTLINILVSCPRGLHFVSSVDATEFVHDAPSLFKLLDKVVDEMGEENIVQVITQNTPIYEAAGKMLEEKRQNLFWTPCAASCIEQMLEDFVKIKWVAECIEKGQKITKLVYNQMWLWNLMKQEYTNGQELVRASFTSVSSSFVTLQSLMDHRTALKRLFQSTKWLSSRLSKSHEGEEVEKIVMNATFWKKVQCVRRSVGPILEVLEKINDGGGDSMSMPYIYSNMYKVKFAIKSNHGDDPHKYGNACSIIHNHSLNHPLYLAAYFLNPSYRYRPDFVPYPEVVRGLNSCIVRFEPNTARRVLASKQIADFCSAKADFGTDLAISTRTELNPAAWWQQHGINCLELQQIAVRILSQTCSCFGCDHTYDGIHKRRYNRLAQKRLKDLIYVHYNLRLKERQIRPTTSSDSLFVQENLLYDWIVKPGKQEDEEMDYEENGLFEYEQGNGEGRKGGSSLDIQPLDSHPPEDEDDDLNFLDEESD
ncbi:putative transcription factor/ chromatin remodeling BED-type(Zn) family [Helianthus debilis subsp. tardiflorus]